jgi:DNA-binding SARP family transcriptional activator
MKSPATGLAAGRESSGRADVRQDFKILGPLEVMTESGPLVIRGQKQRALLALLLVHAGKVVSTDALLDGLWGEHPPRTATTSLQNMIAQLRKVLGAHRVVTRSPGYALRFDADELDLARFESLLAEARSADAEPRARKLREALELWRGPPLAEFAFEAFAQGEIRRLDELRLGAVEDRIDADLELGRHAELVSELNSLVAEHPLRERLRGQLMLAFYRAGRQAEALQSYQDGRKALVDGLGIDPSPALQHLHRAILGQEAGLEPISTTTAPDHYPEIVRAMLSGRLVPVLGAGAASGRRSDELAAHLARVFECPAELSGNLVQISQFVAVTRGIGPLYDELHAALDEDDVPGPVHRVLAGLPARLRQVGAPQQLIVTTSYDRALEHAFHDADEEVDVVTYLASGRDRGKFLHLKPDGSANVIEIPNAYTALAPDERSVILKIHGQVDRAPAREWESFVVSEDDHISYLAQTDIASVVPVTVAAKLRRSHFLFLGYPLLEWHLRVFLHRVWGDEKVAYRSWAVEAGTEPMAAEYWRSRGVDSFDVSVEEYLDGLERRLAELGPAS